MHALKEHGSPPTFGEVKTRLATFAGKGVARGINEPYCSLHSKVPHSPFSKCYFYVVYTFLRSSRKLDLNFNTLFAFFFAMGFM